MKIVITETIGQVTEIENKVTELTVSPFDVAADAIMKSTLQAKGDLVAGTGVGTYARVPAASGDGKALLSDSTQTNGVAWGDAGGDVSVSLTNQSGSSVANGDVVVLDSANDSSFTTTTTPNDLRVLGVAGETINAAASGKVKTIAGTLATVNCDTGAVNRGEWLVASATIKLAKSAGYFNCPGAFAIAVTSKSAGSTGTVQAILVQGFKYGVSGTTAWAAGGQNATAAITDTQKFIMASAAWATVSGAALPAARTKANGNSYSNIAGYSIGGSDTGGTSQVQSYKLTFGVETFANNTGMNFGTATQYLTSGLNEATKGYNAGGYTTTYVSSCNKFVYATDTRTGIGSMSVVAAGWRNTFSDNVYGYVVFATGQKITYSTDAVAAHSACNVTMTYSGSSINFPAVAGYGFYLNTISYCSKVTFATGNHSTITAPSNQHVTGQGVTDGAAYGWFCGDSGSPYSVADKFTQSTETFSVAAGAVQNPGKYFAAYFNNGAI